MPYAFNDDKSKSFSNSSFTLDRLKTAYFTRASYLYFNLGFDSDCNTATIFYLPSFWDISKFYLNLDIRYNYSGDGRMTFDNPQIYIDLDQYVPEGTFLIFQWNGSLSFSSSGGTSSSYDVVIKIFLDRYVSSGKIYNSIYFEVGYKKNGSFAYPDFDYRIKFNKCSISCQTPQLLRIEQPIVARVETNANITIPAHGALSEVIFYQAPGVNQERNPDFTTCPSGYVPLIMPQGGLIPTYEPRAGESVRVGIYNPSTSAQNYTSSYPLQAILYAFPCGIEYV